MLNESKKIGSESDGLAHPGTWHHGSTEVKGGGISMKKEKETEPISHPKETSPSTGEEWEEEEFEPNAYLGLGANPVKMDEELHSIINGAGGKLEQYYLYLSPSSAATWLRTTALEDYKAAVSIPVEGIVDAIHRRIQKTTPGQKNLSIVAMGSAEAQQEQRMVQTFIRRNFADKIKLYLVDISYPLLNVGLEDCQKVFAPYPNVKPRALYQNFFTLPQNKKFVYSLHRQSSAKLVTMLGQTFSNLENEYIFLRHTLGIFPPKTMLLIDIILPFADAQDEGMIRQKDPQLAKGRPWAERANQFLALPFIQHHSQVKTHSDVSFVSVLDNQTCQIKGSYAIEVRASAGDHEFTVQRYKRYALDGLIDAFSRQKWSLVSTYPFYGNRHVAVLFQKE